jgi:hypothetical protein
MQQFAIHWHSVQQFAIHWDSLQHRFSDKVLWRVNGNGSKGNGIVASSGVT